MSLSASAISENGGTAIGTVTRSNTDLGSSLTVTPSGSDSSEATIPSTVTIPASQASADFAGTAIDDTLLDGTQTVTITVSYSGYVNGTRILTVTEYETLSVVVAPASIPENGGTATGALFINGRFLSGARPLDSFTTLVDEELRKASDRVAQGTKRSRYYEEWVVEQGKKTVDPIVAAPGVP